MRKLSDYYDFLKSIRDSVIATYSVESQPSIEEIFAANRNIVIMNHSTPLSWIPVISVLATQVCEQGFGQRIPRGIIDRWFYTNPFTQKLAEYVSQSSRPLTFEELVDSFSQANNCDLVLFPEGANTFFGDPQKLQTFRSPKFIEIAMATQAPIVVAVHKGSEHWSVPIPISKEWIPIFGIFSQFFSRALSEHGAINFPFPSQKISQMKIKIGLFKPELSTLSQNQVEKNMQLQKIAHSLHQFMSEQLDSIT